MRPPSILLAPKIDKERSTERAMVVAAPAQARRRCGLQGKSKVNANARDSKAGRRPDRGAPEWPSFSTSVYDAVARLARQLRSAQLPDGMTLERLSTLGAIRAREPVSLSDLAAMESVSAGAMSRSVAALEAQGLIARKQHAEDARTVLLTTTAKGERLFTRTLHDYISHLVETLGGMSEEQRAAIQEILARVGKLSARSE